MYCFSHIAMARHCKSIERTLMRRSLLINHVIINLFITQGNEYGRWSSTPARQH